MKTERLVILVTPEEKQRISARAKDLNLSTSEIVRRAVETFRPNERQEEEILDRIAGELETSTKQARQALSAAQKAVDETLAHFARKRSSPTEAS